MRKLVATLAVRNQGSRLYGKPLQNLDIENGVTIIDHIVSLLKTIDVIDSIVLGVAEGDENKAFIEYAKQNKIGYIVGSEEDVLMRLIQCVEHENGTDSFRITTESPFPYFEMINKVWEAHISNNNDVSVIDGLPEGSHFEIYSLDALKKSHELGEAKHRSEFCSLYIRENRDDFKIQSLQVPSEVQRLKDFRLTVDYPEDLVLCRGVYKNLQGYAPRIPLVEIIKFLENNDELNNLIKPYIYPEMLW